MTDATRPDACTGIAPGVGRIDVPLHTAPPVEARSSASAGRAFPLLGLLAPAGVYLAVRAVGTIVLALLASANRDDFGNVLGAWDGHWFLGIAQGGYGGVPIGLTDAFGVRTAETPLAFFPGYPAVVAVVRFLTGLPLLGAAVVTTLAAGVAASYALVRIGEVIPGGSRRAGLLFAALFAAAPLGVVLSMAYSEALFCACAAWALLWLLERRWALAGVACLVAGIVRPSAAALVLVVVGTALVALHRRADGARPWAAVLLAPLGLLGYLGWVALATGSLTGWFDLQSRGWGSRFDGGGATAAFIGSVLTSGRSVLEVGTVLVLAGAVALLVLAVRDAAMGALPWPLVAYAAAALAMDLGSDGLMASKARLLLPAFTLLVPVALALAARRRGGALGVVVTVVLVTSWFGAYAVTIWPSAI
jgi:hypothetical protein